jgi:hypothetical protein
MIWLILFLQGNDLLYFLVHRTLGCLRFAEFQDQEYDYYRYFINFKEEVMKAFKIPLVLLACVFTLGNVHAGKPTQGADGPYIGNGFPSGPHFNLNIHGKNESFNCPEPTYLQVVSDDPIPDDGISPDDVFDTCPDGYTCTDGEQVFGNVINVPREGIDVQIQVESGRKGPKTKESAIDLEVTDWCASVGGDDDPASFRLPADPDGYAVYARVTGKPTDDPYFEIHGRQFSLVEVECAEGDTSDNCTLNNTYDLLLLGVVYEDGTFTPGTDGILERVDSTDGRGGKGVKNATNITSLFEFTGSVCYVYEDDPACGDPSFPCDPVVYCCATDWTTGDYIAGPNGVACELKSDGLFTYYDANLDANAQSCDTQDTELVDDWIEQTLYCREYIDAWIFNIADFVNVLFDVNNNGAYNVQLRFYPLPLQEGKVK